MKLTRRELAGVLACGAAVQAQSPSETPEQLRKAASEEVRRDSAEIAKFKVPVVVEPAFSFRAQ
jgi:hypothetical protein